MTCWRFFGVNGGLFRHNPILVPRLLTVALGLIGGDKPVPQVANVRASSVVAANKDLQGRE